MIFQDPMSSLNPKKQAGELIRESLVIQHIGKSRSEQDKIVKEMLEKVGIPIEYRNRYPKDFSGGQRQRIGIARACQRRAAVSFPTVNRAAATG